MLSEISQRKTVIYFHSYVDLEKLNRRPWGRKGERIVTNREGGKQTIRNLNTENKLKVDGGEGKVGDGH